MKKPEICNFGSVDPAPPSSYNSIKKLNEILIDENAEYDVALDTKITDELKSEGEVREIIRSIQEERKKALLNTGEKVDITIHTDETIKKLIEAHLKKIQEVTNVSKIRYASSGEKLITIDR